MSKLFLRNCTCVLPESCVDKKNYRCINNPGSIDFTHYFYWFEFDWLFLLVEHYFIITRGLCHIWGCCGRSFEERKELSWVFKIMLYEDTERPVIELWNTRTTCDNCVQILGARLAYFRLFLCAPVPIDQWR